jgi:hypothetical protein
MAVKQIGVTTGGNIKRFTCLAADTAAWLANPANALYGDGSTLRELDGNQDLYELQSGNWYIQ